MLFEGIILLFIGALGSIPTRYFVARLSGLDVPLKDLRRSLGWPYRIMLTLLDVCMAFIIAGIWLHFFEKSTYWLITLCLVYGLASGVNSTFYNYLRYRRRRKILADGKGQIS